MTSYVYVEHPLPTSRRVADDYGVVEDREIRARCHAARGTSHYFWIGVRESGDCLLYKGTYESPPDGRQYQEHLFRYHDYGVDVTAVEVVDNVGGGGSALLESGGPGSDMAAVKVRSGCMAPLDDTFYVYGFRNREEALPPPYTVQPHPFVVPVPQPQHVAIQMVPVVRQRMILPEPEPVTVKLEAPRRSGCPECPPSGRCPECPPSSCPECPPQSSGCCGTTSSGCCSGQAKRSGCCDSGSSCCDRGSGCTDRGSGCSDRGSGCCDRGSSYSDRGSGCCDRGSGCSERGSGCNDRGSGCCERGSSQSSCSYGQDASYCGGYKSYPRVYDY